MTMLECRPETLAHPAREPRWVDICGAEELEAGRGVCALIGGHQVAVFLLPDASLYALDNRDPFSYANVMSRGLTGSVGAAPTVASPVYKQRFDLRSGCCLDDPSVWIRTFGICRVGTRVLVESPD